MNVVAQTGSEAEKEEDRLSQEMSEMERGTQVPTKEQAAVFRKEFDEAYEQVIKDLTEKRDAAHEREQSLPNRLLGGAAIGVTGIGGMMLASGLAEQSSDADAEQAMRAYLETFTCRYGDSKSVRGGTTNVELPGGNELFNLYVQYATLAEDLKIRKAALNIKPGIESEVIVDKSTTGLYDDVGTGVASGVYASIARAIQNPNGEDAKKWGVQSGKSLDKTKAGAITSGVGAIGGAVGNVMINDWDGKGGKK